MARESKYFVMGKTKVLGPNMLSFELQAGRKRRSTGIVWGVTTLLLTRREKHSACWRIPYRDIQAGRGSSSLATLTSTWTPLGQTKGCSGGRDVGARPDLPK